MIKKIYTILVLIYNVLVRKKHYTLGFFSEMIGETKVWYYDFKHWGFEKYNLMMVSGADELCEKFSNGNDMFKINIIASRKEIINHEGYDEYKAIEPIKEFTFLDRIVFGREYVNTEKGDKMWICPVTLFVLGRYPKYIYIDNK